VRLTEYLVPVLDETFDRAAAEQLRTCLELYELAPDVIKGLLENVAIVQRARRPDGAGTSTTPISVNTCAVVDPRVTPEAFEASREC